MFHKKLMIGIIIIFAILIIALLIIRVPGPEEKAIVVEPEAMESEVTEPEVIPVSLPALLASGKQVYEVMTASDAQFKITEAEFDPLDVKEGESQRARVLIEDLEDKPITQENKVEGVAYTDNKTTFFSFELKEVSDSNNSTLTEWEAFWVLDDTYDKIYIISITAKSAGREHKIDITFR